MFITYIFVFYKYKFEFIGNYTSEFQSFFCLNNSRKGKKNYQFYILIKTIVK